jgi:hypothetical protein
VSREDKEPKNHKGMTPVQIAYFKHFLFDKSIERSYISYYRKYRIKGSPRGDKDGNPESIEEFFLNTTVKDVIMKAFTLFPSNMDSRANSTFDYWKDIDDKWQDYMSQNEGNLTNDSWPQLRKTFAVLRQNWDLPYYWSRDNLESTEEVYRRMHIDLPLPDFQWEHGYIQRVRQDSELIKYDIHNAKDGDFVVRTRVLKNGTIGRTIFIVKEVVPYDPETSEFKPEQLHVNYDPEKKNIYIVYLHARYTSMGESFSTDYKDEIVHSVVDDNIVTENYRLAFKGEEQTMILKLADHHLAWNPATKTIVPLLEALNARNEEEALADYSEEEEYDDPLSDFEFLDDVKTTRNKMKTNEVSINFNNSYKITFNVMASEVIRESKLPFVRLAKSKAGDICLVFNLVGGANITNKTGVNSTQNVTINSKDICEKLRTLFSIRPDYSILRIERLQSKNDYIIYKITKQQ